MDNKWVAFDFDGTIVDHEYPNYGKIKPETIELMQELKREGYMIMIYSCRNNRSLYKTTKEYLEGTNSLKIFLRENNILFNEIWPYEKPVVSMIFDDRACSMREVMTCNNNTIIKMVKGNEKKVQV